MPDQQLNKDTVRSRLQQKQYVLRVKNNIKNAELWRYFRTVCDAETGQYVQYVICVKCNTLYYLKEGASTSSIGKHSQKCKESGQMGLADERTGRASSPSTASPVFPTVAQSILPGPSTSFVSPPPPPPPTSMSQPSSSSTLLSTPSPKSPMVVMESGASVSESDNTSDSVMKPKKRRKNEITREDKQKVTDLCVKFSARDLRSYSVIGGAGFQQLAQGLIDVGAKYGKIDVKNVIPHPSTVSRKTSAVADHVRGKFCPEVQKALKEGCCSFETDMWTDKFTKRAYLTLDCQYTTAEFELNTLTLFTVEFPADQKKSGENIRKLIESEFKEMGFAEEDVKKAAFVTDEGSNIKSALQDYNRLNCTAHVLATVLRRIFDFDKKPSKSFLFQKCPEVYKCIMACKSMATYIKRSGRNLQLAKTVKMMVETRWNTLLDMIESIVAMRMEIIALLEENGESGKLDGWDADVATELITFLSPFRDISVELQAKKHPTLHLVLVRFHDLLKQCERDDGNGHAEIAIIRSRAKELLQAKIRLEDVQYAAAFLCPNTRNLKLLDADGRERARTAVLRLLEQMSSEDSQSRETEENAQPPQPKRGRFGDWSEDDDNGDSAQSTAEVEIDFYLKVGKPDSDDPASLLPWWKSKAPIFTRLSRVARSVLAIPATSATSERTFSRAGLIITDKRTNLGPKKVNDLLVLHNYYLGNSSRLQDTSEPKIFVDTIEDSGGEDDGDVGLNDYFASSSNEESD